MTRCALLLSIFLLTFFSQEGLVAKAEEDEETTETPAGCVKLYICCERGEDGCITYCEPTIECSPGDSTTEAAAGYKIIAAPCRKGYRSFAGTCKKMD